VETLSEPSPRRPLSPARTAAAAAGVAVLLAVVSAATGATGRTGVPGGGAAAAVGGHVLLVVVLALAPLALAAGVAVVLYGQMLRRRDPALAALRRRARRRTVAFVLVVVAILAYTVRTGTDPFGFLHVARRLGFGRGGGSAPAGGGAPRHGGATGLDLGLVAAAWLAFLVGAVVLLRRRLQLRSAPAAEVAGEAVDDDAGTVDLDALRAERDPRRAVVAAYAAMERVMAARALGRRRAEAPVEYAGRIAAAGAAGAEHARRLTGIYLAARFGAGQVAPGQRDAAVAAVAALLDDGGPA
jgi:Domain of unknown function (DUF4129)